MRKILIFVLPIIITVLVVVYFISPLSNQGISSFISIIRSAFVSEDKSTFQSADASGSKKSGGFTEMIGGFLGNEELVPMQDNLTTEEENYFRTDPAKSSCIMEAYQKYINNWYIECKKLKKDSDKCNLPQSTGDKLTSSYQQQKQNCIN